MMSKEAPVATGTMSTSFPVTTVTVGARCKVCYEFDTRASSAELALPYLVSIDGKVQETAGGKPSALHGKNRKITLSVPAGSRVALYLNSDVHPDHRRNPVYALQVGQNDVLVKVVERKGRIGHVQATVGTPQTRQAEQAGARATDCYDAQLTGDIWMQISHRYTVDEVPARLPPDVPAAIQAAVCSIYAGLRAPRLQVTFPANDSTPAQTINVAFAEAENAQANTTHCPLLSEVLPRTHPSAFAALLTEAHNAGVTEILVTSCWRPMLGSIIHRAGLGLDVTYLANSKQRVRLTRVGLTGKSSRQSENVSELEKKLYLEYETAKNQSKKNTTGSKKIVDEKKDHWNMERDQNEPELLKIMRKGLSHHPCVKQIFDPWYMAASVAEQKMSANEQIRPIEKLHADHMHLTISEPQIL
ncbi:MAG: hypothetical protein ACEQSK_11685 [Sphingomonadaceae bacterium]